MRSATAAVNDGPVIATGGTGAPPDRATRRGVGLLLAFLALPALGAAVSAQLGGWGWSLTAMVGLKVLVILPQLVHSLPTFRQARDRYWRWTFASLVVLTFGPHLAFGAQWTSGGLLAGSALLLFRAPTSWVVLGLVLAAEGAFQLVYGADPVWTLLIVIDGVLVMGLAAYILTRLIDLLGDLHETRVATALAVTGHERLRAAREVFARLGPHLLTTARSAERARRAAGTDPATASPSVVELGQLARRALGDVRDAARAFRDGGPDVAPATGAHTTRPLPSTEPRLAFVVIVVMSVTGAVVNLLGIATRQQPGPVATVAAAVGLAMLVVLQIYHAAPRDALASPRAWGWTLSAQFLLVYLPVVAFGTIWMGMSVYLAACVLVVLRPPVSWLLFAAVTAALPAIMVALPDKGWYESDPMLTNTITVLLDFGYTVLVFRAPMLLAASVVRLRAARAELVRMMLVRERLGVARDVHDLLGSSLSAVALKADLAQRLLPRDPRRAQTELADAADLAHRAITEARALDDGAPDTSLAQELASARSMLAAADITTDITPCPDGLPARAEGALAIVVREAVTNLLRHSAARHCTISLSIEDNTAKLRITNDGVTTPAGTGAGTGIGNLNARLDAVGGRLDAAPHGHDGFSLAADVPIGAHPL